MEEENLKEKEQTPKEIECPPEKSTFIEYELSEDLQEFLIYNDDVNIELKLKEQVEGYKEGTLLEIKKVIGSAITISSVDEVTENLTSIKYF